MKKKLSAGEITELFFYRGDSILGREKPERVREKGKKIHKELGFDNSEIFMKEYPYETKEGVIEYWEIRGMPDRIFFEEGYVDELKTYTPKEKEKQIESGKTQANIYAYLTNLKPRLFLYNQPKKRMEDIIEFEFNEDKLNMDITLAIELKYYIEDFVENYKNKVRLVYNLKV